MKTKIALFLLLVTTFSFSEKKIPPTSLLENESPSRFNLRPLLDVAGKRRILFIGDSHIYADFFTGKIREELTKCYGDGGRGFVIPKDKPSSYGQQHVSTYTSDGWAMSHSKTLKKETPQKNGHNIYGLAMKKNIALKPGAYITVNSSTSKSRTIEIYALFHPNGGEIAIEIDGNFYKNYQLRGKTHQASRVIITTPNSFHSVKITSLQKSTLLENTPALLENAPVQIFGVAIENLDAGVVVDAIGLNGARLTTLLNIEKKTFQQFLNWREYKAIFVCFGANDILYQKVSFHKFQTNFNEILTRVHETSPKLPVLFILPPDMLPNIPAINNYKTVIPENMKIFHSAVIQVAHENNTPYWSQYLAMGGEGSIFKWTELGLAQKDNIHLTKAGYEKLANQFLKEFLR